MNIKIEYQTSTGVYDIGHLLQINSPQSGFPYFSFQSSAFFGTFSWLDNVINSVDISQRYVSGKNGSKGKVYITGFGPGDPDLLTIKALKALAVADVIFFDDLIDKKVLKNYNAEKIYVGKRKGNHSYSQLEINELLYQSAKSGKTTIRLKGGDPFIFGRGGEEYKYLRKRQIEVEVIPGITAAFGAAATAGISLTHRGISSSVAFCTGFPKTNRAIPNADTLVFYMSASNLRETALLLIKSGRTPETPVALIRNATLSTQQTLYANLLDISLGNAALASPMVAIIGEVATDKMLINNQMETLNETIDANVFANDD